MSPSGSGAEQLSQFAISKLTESIEREPDEFVFHYMLADHLQRVGQLAEAVRVAREACEVAPADPRAPYALATVLRSLPRAKYNSPEYSERLPEMVQFFAQLGEVFDPALSQDALDELGMSIEESVRQVIAAFDETLRRGVRRGERRLVTESVAAMSGEFPEYL